MVIKLRIKLGLKLFESNANNSLETSKLSYMKMNLGNKTNNPNTSQKSFWKIINRVMNNPLKYQLA